MGRLSLTHKKCGTCKEVKPFSEFFKSKSHRTGYGYRCKLCDNEARKLWRTRNKERARLSARRRTLKRKYSLTLEQYDDLLTRQNGGCAICGVKENLTGPYNENNFCVDHDHITGELRGLLCNSCNRGLVLFKDNWIIVQNALNYLERYQN